MVLLDLYFRDGKTQTVRGVDYCTMGNGCLCVFDSIGRLILRQRHDELDHIEVRIESEQKHANGYILKGRICSGLHIPNFKSDH